MKPLMQYFKQNYALLLEIMVVVPIKEEQVGSERECRTRASGRSIMFYFLTWMIKKYASIK